MIVTVEREVPRYESYAAERTRGLYNVDADDGSSFRFVADVPADQENWSIGCVVGPSGSGKSSILQELEKTGWRSFEPDVLSHQPLVEQLGQDAPYAKVTGALAAVGLGSVPSWLRPMSVLSNGEQFRAGLAQLLLGNHHGDRVLIDEFTSVLDRQVAKVGAGAFAKAWRRQKGRRIIVFTPHYDVLDWLQPDWWLDTQEGLNEFAQDRGVVRARQGDFQAANRRARYRGNRVGSVAC